MSVPLLACPFCGGHAKSTYGGATTADAEPVDVAEALTAKLEVES